MAFLLIVILGGFGFSGDWLQSLLLWYSPKYWPNNDESTEEHIILKMKFSIKDYFSKWPNPQFIGDLITFTEEIPNGKLYFFCAVVSIGPA